MMRTKVWFAAVAVQCLFTVVGLAQEPGAQDRGLVEPGEGSPVALFDITAHTDDEIAGEFRSDSLHISFTSRLDGGSRVVLQVQLGEVVLDAEADLERNTRTLDGHGRALSLDERTSLRELSDELERYLDPYRRELSPHTDLLFRVFLYWGEVPVGWALERRVISVPEPSVSQALRYTTGQTSCTQGCEPEDFIDCIECGFPCGCDGDDDPPVYLAAGCECASYVLRHDAFGLHCYCSEIVSAGCDLDTDCLGRCGFGCGGSGGAGIYTKDCAEHDRCVRAHGDCFNPIDDILVCFDELQDLLFDDLFADPNCTNGCWCGNGVCDSGETASNCCQDCGDCCTNGDCNDGNTCTSDQCVGGSCQNNPIGNCDSNSDCNDGNSCTTDQCVNCSCQNNPIGNCDSNSDCNDGNSCTIDQCVNCSCQNIPECTSDGQCNDGDPCTTDGCNADGCCEHNPPGECCVDVDCDDGDPCTDDSCMNNSCQNMPECTSDGQCNDGDPCTLDLCNADGCCENNPPGECCVDGDCDDVDPCTEDSCVDGECQHTPISPCCGDGLLDPGEDCDPPGSECPDGQTCPTDCTCDGGAGCQLVCPPGALEEGESCGSDTNGGCNSDPPIYTPAACGDIFCGTAWASDGSRDTDWYLVNHSGGTLNASLTSQFQGVVAIFDGIDGCETVSVGEFGCPTDCSIGQATAELPPGQYAVFVSPGTCDGGGIFHGVPCGGGINDYVLEIGGDCAPECGNGVTEPGEECDGSDDDACPGLCLPDCNCPPVPVNDNCQNSLAISDGDTAYDTTGADTDGQAHASCEFDGQTYHDIWYDYVASCTGDLTVSTCDQAAYDTDLVVYGGCQCPMIDADLLACSDDSSGCAGFTSEVTVAAVQGNCHKVRVGGFNDGDMGAGTLTIACVTVCDCNDGFCDPDCGEDPCNCPGDCQGCCTDSDCDDGLFCNGEETCDPQAGCQPGTPPCAVDCCEDNDACGPCLCTSDEDCDDELCCNEDTGECGPCPCKSDEDCDDLEPCTQDACDPDDAGADAVGCVHDPVQDGTGCDDLKSCTSDDSCQSGTCTGTLIPCCPCCPNCTNRECGSDGCGGSCGTCADDGLFCTGDPVCTNGTCQFTGNPCGGDTPVCCEASDSCVSECCMDDDCPDDGNPCTNEVCSNGSCTHPNKPNGTSCDDGQFCNGSDMCSNGSCQHAGNPCPGPDGDNDCSESCNEGQNNCTANDPNGSTCNDGEFCNGSDTCSSGSCSNHSGNPCEGTAQPICDEDNGACAECLSDDGCDDGNICTDDTCDDGTCTGAPIVDCVPCTTDADCTGGLECSGDRCQPPQPEPCVTVAECLEGESCVNSLCRVGCESDADCEEGQNCVDNFCFGPCATDEHCSDGMFCNGEEICLETVCTPGEPPCEESECCEENLEFCYDPQLCGAGCGCTPQAPTFGLIFLGIVGWRFGRRRG